MLDSMSTKKDTRSHILETTWKLLEAHPGKSLSMSEIAKTSGVSRQALYLHFSSRADLLIATTRYVDEVKQLDQQLDTVMQCPNGTEMLKTFVETWGNYIPQVFNVSKALMITKDHDEAAAEAWKEIMGCLHALCDEITKRLSNESRLSTNWSQRSASDFLYTLVSIYNWEQLTHECNWTQEQYLQHIQHAVKKSLLTK